MKTVVVSMLGLAVFVSASLATSRAWECHQRPAMRGLCRSNTPRFTYDPKRHDCVRFNYGGCGGNANNFATKAACVRVCKPTLPTCQQTPRSAGSCKGHHHRYSYDYKMKSCVRFAYGGCGGNDNNFRSMRECQKKCRPCRQQPRVSGACSRHISRYSYDHRRNKCHWFVYGGCGGNDNNFATRQKCEKKCLRTDRCDQQPRVVGPCRAAMRRYSFIVNLGKCAKFVYGGCRGNGNNFKNLATCQKKCLKNDPCQQKPRVTGPCKGYHPRYTFIRYKRKCVAFVYGGCHGNANSFRSLSKCNEKCVG